MTVEFGIPNSIPFSVEDAYFAVVSLPIKSVRIYGTEAIIACCVDLQNGQLEIRARVDRLNAERPFRHESGRIFIANGRLMTLDDQQKLKQNRVEIKQQLTQFLGKRISIIFPYVSRTIVQRCPVIRCSEEGSPLLAIAPQNRLEPA
jgi:hypothetical protein